MRLHVLLATLLLAVLPVESSRAQTICGVGADRPWCDRATIGPDDVFGTADDRSACVPASPPPGTADCSQHASDRWSFGGLAACSDCPRTLFLAVNCGEELWVVIDHAQAMTLSVTDLAYGPLALEAENECVYRNGWLNPFAYCDACGLGGPVMPKDDPFTDGVLGKNAGTCTTNMGVAPELPCLQWRAAGTSITWGRPLDVDPGPGVVFDADGDGFVDATEPMPCTPCLTPTCPCGATSQDDRAMTGQFVRMKVSLPTAIPGEAHLLRVDMITGSEPTWTVVANCDGTTNRGYTLHDTCAGAMTELATMPALPSLTLDPEPSIALSIVDTSNCPDSMTVAVTTCNSGSAPAASVPVALMDHNGFGIGQTDVDNAAHPTDPACQTPLDPGECRTCIWEVFATMPSMTISLEAVVDIANVVDECGDFALRGGCGIGPERASVPWCGAPSCFAEAQLVAGAASACVGDIVTLDASATTIASCPGSIELQYTDDAGVPLPGGDFPALPTLDWTPTSAGMQRLRLNARCSTDPACADAAFVDVDVPSPSPFASAIAATPEGECALRVTWDASASAPDVSYDLHRSDVLPVALDASTLIASGLTVTTYLDTPPWGTAQAYRVVAVEACSRTPNDGGDSAPASAVDLFDPAFAGIVNTRDLGFCEVEVSWDDATASDSCSGVAGFNVYRDHGVGHRGETRVASLVPASPYIDTTPGNGTWVYVVRAVDAAGHEEQNDIFQQESEGSCTNDFPGDAGLGPDGGVDSPNADHLRSAPGSDRREIPGRELGRDPVLAGGAWDDGRLRLRWSASVDEGGLYPVTYSVLRGDLGALGTVGYSHALATPTSCGLTLHELILDDEIDGRSSYYLVVSVSGDNATFGYDSSGRELPAATVCE